jgi:uncharacterized protein (DUF488 family)
MQVQPLYLHRQLVPSYFLKRGTLNEIKVQNEDVRQEPKESNSVVLHIQPHFQNHLNSAQYKKLCFSMGQIISSRVHRTRRADNVEVGSCPTYDTI